MAQPIHCDGEGHQDALADVLVTNLANGDTSAWCFDHYVAMSRAVVATFDQAEADRTDAEALGRLEGVTPPGGSDQESDAGAGAASPAPATDEPEGSPSPGEPGDSEASEPAPAPPDLGVGTFRPEGDEPVQDGLGGSETGATGEAGPEPTAVENGPPGAPTAGTEDAGEAPAELYDDVPTA